MMTKQRKSLYRDPNYRDLDEELSISVKTLFSLFLLTVLFIVFCCLIKGPTYGVL